MEGVNSTFIAFVAQLAAHFTINAAAFAVAIAFAFAFVAPHLKYLRPAGEQVLAVAASESEINESPTSRSELVVM